MSPETIQDILPFVQQPSRYLGTEVHSVRKIHVDVDLKIVLAFPDLYEIGTSHFGMQILYNIINDQKNMLAERVFAPAQDFARQLKAKGLSLASLESRTPLAQFDIIGFSLLYELNYTNILTMLELAEIPVFSSQRGDADPLIIAGGPCTCNPEPVADFFDAILIGDGEEALLAMAKEWLTWKKNGSTSKRDLLKAWADIQGVYIPSMYVVNHQNDNETGRLQQLQPVAEEASKISRAIVADLEATAFPTRPVVPFGRPVHDRLRLELARGCTRGCRFCQAGMLYRPVRERSPAALLNLTRDSLAATGYDDISLLSLSTGDYGCIESMLERLMTDGHDYPTAVSLPSLRAGSLSPRMMELIKRVRKTGFTLAPEAGTQRLRDVINKNISEDDILQTVTQAFGLGWQVIKLYFMIGLPTETDEDLDGIIELVDKIQRIKGPQKKRNQVNVSVTTFIPKPFTPFQWAPQLPLSESRRRIRYLQEALRRPGVKFKWQLPEVSYLEGLWSRGDRRLAPLLVAAHKKGCQFDGWTDFFRFDHWLSAIHEMGIDADFFVTRTRALDEPLPWDHIDIGVSKSYLRQEWDHAHRTSGALTTPDCRTEACSGCGVCDFEKIQPRVFEPETDDTVSMAPTTENSRLELRKFHLIFSRLDDARFFGHLELVNIFCRAMRRAAIPVTYTQGFHPKPKIAFTDALPIGIESRAETMKFTAHADMDFNSVPEKLNRQLPAGLRVSFCGPGRRSSRETKSATVEYGVHLTQSNFLKHDLDSFTRAESFTVTKKGTKGKLKTIDLKAMIKDIRIRSPRELRITMGMDGGPPPRPAVIMTHIFGLDDIAVKTARIVKYPDLK